MERNSTDADETTSTDNSTVPAANVAPTDLTLNSVTINENVANGSVVGTVAVTDADAGETFSYSLTDDAGGRFAIDASTGAVTVADGSLLDHETATSHQMTVEITDSAGNTYSESLTIGVNDVNESTDTSLSEVLSHNPVMYLRLDGTTLGNVEPEAGVHVGPMVTPTASVAVAGG